MLVVKYPPANTGDVRDASSIPGWGRSTGGGMATHSTVLAWRIPWSEEPGGLRSMRVQSQTLLKRLSAHIPPHALYKSGASSAQREGRQTWLQRHRCSPSPAHVVSLWSFVLPSPSHPQPLALLISGMALGRGLTLGIKSLSDHTHSTTWPVLASLQTQPHGMSEPVTSSIHQNTSSTR